MTGNVKLHSRRKGNTLTPLYIADNTLKYGYTVNQFIYFQKRRF